MVALLVSLLACTPTPPPTGGLRLNEVMSGNDGAVLDDTDPVCPEADDWIELVNTGTTPVALHGLTLSDSATTATLPPLDLAPGAHLLLWADDQPEQGPTHLPFRVSAEGEGLTLRRGDLVVDEVYVPSLRRDRTWGRVTDGSGDWVEFNQPTPGAANQPVLPDDPCFEASPGFDDHGYPCLSTDDSFLALAGDRTDELAIVKFTIFAFDDPNARRMAFVDTGFYTLHDQFYLFTVFNGEPFEGLYAYPPYPGSFRTWGELDRWARGVDLGALVDDDMARFAGTRLYSPYFYSAINGDDRHTGVGTIIHRPATDDREALWAFELEYLDAIDYDALVVYFETLQAHGPPGFADLHWLIRSPEQVALAEQMAAEGLPYGDRTLRYEDLTEPGFVEVYHPGLTAGRVRILGPGDALDEAQSTDILVLQSIPDELPPCAALITTVPQTELSHVSLLAASRGIPNLHVAGLHADPLWDTWNRRATWVALEATTDGSFRAADIGLDAYEQWQSLTVDQPPELEPLDPDTLPWSVDLATGPDMLALRPQVGGKAAGLRLLLDEPLVDAPDTPLALTIRGYHRHLGSLPWLADTLGQPPFSEPDALAERYLVLHGLDAYRDRYTTEIDEAVADAFLEAHADTLLGDLAASDGLTGRIARLPMPSDVEAELVGAVEAQFAWLPADQGLRFRSSSTVEDLEGFNGAGLYTSESGHRDPDPGDASVSEAIREVWASYWGAEAYEERETAGIDHLAGGMGVLVHPRFDDAYEQSNAVLTASRLPDGTTELLVNAQHGATSVANPPVSCPPVRPERVRIREAADGLAIERLEGSSLVAPGSEVLTDEQLQALFDASSAALDRWIDAENEAVAAPQARSVLTLDLEAREMAAGWPDGATGSDRLVLKQARSLDPGIAGLPDDLQLLPAPFDVLARAEHIEAFDCVADELRLSAVWVRTDPRSAPDLGYRVDPLVVSVEAEALQPIESLGWAEGEVHTWNHTDWIDAEVAEERVTVAWPGGGATLAAGYELTVEGVVIEGSGDCTPSTLWAAPSAFLLDALEQTQ